MDQNEDLGVISSTKVHSEHFEDEDCKSVVDSQTMRLKDGSREKVLISKLN